MEPVTERGVTFPLEMTDDGKGFKIPMSQVTVTLSDVEEPFEPSGGLPRKLAKVAKRQPKFGLLKAEPNDEGEILFRFNKPIGQIGDRLLREHIFTPMARKIRRSHQSAASTKRNRRGAPSGHKGYHNKAPVAQASI